MAPSRTDQDPRLDPDVRAVVSLDRRILEAYVVENDPSLLVEHALEDYVVLSPGGTESLAHVVATVGHLDVSTASFEVSDVRRSGTLLTIVGFVDAQGHLGGRPMPRLGYLSVWSNEAGRWRLVARSLVPQAQREPAGP